MIVGEHKVPLGIAKSTVFGYNRITRQEEVSLPLFCYGLFQKVEQS